MSTEILENLPGEILALIAADPSVPRWLRHAANNPAGWAGQQHPDDWVEELGDPGIDIDTVIAESHHWESWDVRNVVFRAGLVLDYIDSDDFAHVAVDAFNVDDPGEYHDQLVTTLEAMSDDTVDTFAADTAYSLRHGQHADGWDAWIDTFANLVLDRHSTLSTDTLTRLAGVVGDDTTIERIARQRNAPFVLARRRVSRLLNANAAWDEIAPHTVQLALDAELIRRIATAHPNQAPTWLAAHPNCPADLLDEWATHPALSVRLAVAQNPATATPTLTQLSTTGTNAARRAALARPEIAAANGYHGAARVTWMTYARNWTGPISRLRRLVDESIAERELVTQ